MTLREQILRLCPRARKEYLDGFEAEKGTLDRLGITANALRWQHFFAQIAHESGGLTIREENLNYSAERMTKVWPGRYRTPKGAAPYAHNPEALANHTYGGRMGNDKPGDGWRYRGRGLLQLTGRSEYRRVGKLIGIDLEGNPDLACDGRVAVKAAAHLFVSYGCLLLADDGNIKAITKRINGGQIGLPDRVAWLRKARVTWPDGIAPATAAAAPEAREEPEEPNEAALPPREPPSPAAVLRESSRKFILLDRILKLLGLTSAASAITVASDFLGLAKGLVEQVTTFVSDHGFLILVLVCLAGAGVVWLLRRMQIDDFEQGRYQPSGGADAGAD